jgi:hypothetical protein
MAAETIVEVYRTQENRAEHFFVTAVTITYFGKTAFIQGLSDTMTIKCWREIREYLIGKGIEEVQYYRHGTLKVLRK